MNKPAGGFVVVLFVLGCLSCDAVMTAEPAPDGNQMLAAASQQFSLLSPMMARAVPLTHTAHGFRPTQAGLTTLHVSLPARADGAMHLSAGPLTLEVRPLGAAPVKGALDGKAAVYPEAHHQAHSFFLAEADRVEQFILLRDASAPTTFRYRVAVTRGRGRVRQRHHTVEVLDQAGIAWLRLQPPYAISADGARVPARVTLERGELTVAVAPGALQYPALFDPGWTTTGKMALGRTGHSATIFGNGKVLVAGGQYQGKKINTVELYDSKSGTWTATGSLSAGRHHHTATLLSTGKVLVAGGQTAKGASASAELYDPISGGWTTTGAMSRSRQGHSATLLGSGSVLVAGGAGSAGSPATAEIYNPYLGKWTNAGSLSNGRSAHTATLLGSGKVLVAGGAGAPKTAEVYNPTTGSWAASGAMKHGRISASAIFLASGKVLLAGGGSGASLATAELFTPKSGKWTATGSMATGRLAFSATLLSADLVLVTGGTGAGASAELYRVSTGGWSSTAALLHARAGHSATLLATGKVLIAGGASSGASTELYNPTTGLSCAKAADCVNGRCVDGICCETDCLQTCRQCKSGPVNLANMQGSFGQCAFVSAGKPDINATVLCSGASACDGKGNCKKANGQQCNAVNSVCGSGHCTNLVCCDSTCLQTCMSCKVSGQQGTCSFVPDMQPDAYASVPCDKGKACDGKGNCRVICGGATCATDLCVDGQCCDKACTGTCMACDVKGKLGSCAMILMGQPDNNAATTCAGDKACDGKGNCKVATGKACNNDGECATGICKDSVCCDEACDKTCESCAVAGKLGNCTAIAAKADPDKECIGKDALCGGSCDGNRGCSFPGVGTGCGTCKACDGVGGCAKTPPDDSACGVLDCDKLDTACRDYQDITVGRCASFGSCKKANEAATCTQFSKLACPDGSGGKDAGGEAVAAPDRGAVKPDPGEDSGCSYGSGGGTSTGGSSAGLIMLLLVSLLRAVRQRRAR